MPLPRLLPLALAASFAAGAASLAAPRAARAGDEAAPAWEQEVERESKEQTRQIEQAKRAKTMGAVVATYANRVSRDGATALNLFLLGRAHYHNEDPAGARAQMRLALQQDAGFWPAHVKLAQLAIELKNWAEAEAQIARALVLKPGNLEALETAWRLAVQREDWTAAAKRLDAFLNRSPGSLEARQALAAVHLERKDWDGALREARILVQADPHSFPGRFFVAVALKRKGDLDGAAKTLEALSAEQPQNTRVLDELRELAVLRKDATALKSVLERMLPLLPTEKQRLVAQWLEALRKDPQGALSPKEGPKAPSWKDVLTDAQGPDVERRRDALHAIYEAVELGYVKEVPGLVVQRVLAGVEPDAQCRCWAVKTCARLSETIFPVLAAALHDEDRTVRMLAAESLGEGGSQVAVVYLLPLVLSSDGMDPLEFETLRSALAAVAGYDDLSEGRRRVSTPEEAAASREAWRRWMISDAASAAKVGGIRRLIALKEPSAEWYLFDFVMDPNFEVMREAYIGMRDSVRREPRSPVEKRLFPTFPRVEDADVTRPAMRSIQDRTAAWRATWVAENRAYREAKGK